jgi:hypothetical protein
MSRPQKMLETTDSSKLISESLKPIVNSLVSLTSGSLLPRSLPRLSVFWHYIAIIGGKVSFHVFHPQIKYLFHLNYTDLIFLV